MTPEMASMMLQVLQIIWIDVLLSGDNAVVIALACRRLPDDQRRLGIFLGTLAAITLRILFAFVIIELMAIPYLKLISGVLLLWIAVKLVSDQESEHDVTAAASLFAAVRTIAIADGVMSLDNVIAIAAAAKGEILLIIFGLLLSIPLIIFGSALVLGLLLRFPILVWAGAALLGWIAGELVGDDPRVTAFTHHRFGELQHWWLPAAGMLFVLVIAGLLWWFRRKPKPTHDVSL